MAKEWRYSTIIVCCLLGGVLAWVCALETWQRIHLVPTVRADDKLRTVTITGAPQVRIINIKAGDQPVKSGLYRSGKVPPVAFSADDDWLRKLSFEVQNLGQSMEKIDYVKLLIILSDSSGNPHITSIQLGRIPDNAAYTGDGYVISQGPARPLSLLPGHWKWVGLGHFNNQITEALGGIVPTAEITQCHIEVDSFFLEDGVRWQGGNYMAPDSGHPGSFELIGPSYVPPPAPREPSQ
ncbi:MAG: hypothetical protein P4N24_18170 [Acidobacteriota bacterium]|nr:hypothetical protein [Acidobacteriota bacterium]